MKSGLSRKKTARYILPGSGCRIRSFDPDSERAANLPFTLLLTCPGVQHSTHAHAHKTGILMCPRCSHLLISFLHDRSVGTFQAVTIHLLFRYVNRVFRIPDFRHRIPAVLPEHGRDPVSSPGKEVCRSRCFPPGKRAKPLLLQDRKAFRRWNPSAPRS